MFDVSNEQLYKEYIGQIQLVVQKLQLYVSFHILFIMYPDSSVQPIRHNVHHVVVFVTTHSHDETGGLFTGPETCTPIEDVSFSPQF